MKEKSLWIAFVLIVLSVCVLGGCASSDISTTSTESVSSITVETKGVNFNSERGSLTISNNTAEDVVIFVGKVEKGNI